MSHGVIVCEGCGARISSCRCMNHYQEVKQGLCATCKGRPALQEAAKPAEASEAEIIDQEKGWGGMPVRVLVSNGKTQEWYYCKGHPLAQPVSNPYQLAPVPAISREEGERLVDEFETLCYLVYSPSGESGDEPKLVAARAVLLARLCGGEPQAPDTAKGGE